MLGPEPAATLRPHRPDDAAAADGRRCSAIAGADPKDLDREPGGRAQLPGGHAARPRGAREHRCALEWRGRRCAGLEGDGRRARGRAASCAEVREFPRPGAGHRRLVSACGIEAAVVHESTYPARKDMYGPACPACSTTRPRSGMDYQKIVLNRLRPQRPVQGALERHRPAAGAGSTAWRRPLPARMGYLRRGRRADVRHAALHACPT